jgi:general secretion pathway protein G
MKRRKLILPVLGSIVALAVIVNGILARQEMRRARESVLRQDLYDLRKLIDMYTQDKQRRPASLQDLTTSGYCRSIPKDPITGSSDTWVIQLSTDRNLPGVTDVHSGSHEIGSDGDPYSAW